MGIVVLNKSLASDVPNFNRFVLGATGNASAVRVELDCVNALFVILERVDELARGKVPKLHGSILGTRGDKSGVWGELAGPDPVLVGLNSEEELSV